MKVSWETGDLSGFTFAVVCNRGKPKRGKFRVWFVIADLSEKNDQPACIFQNLLLRRLVAQIV